MATASCAPRDVAGRAVPPGERTCSQTLPTPPSPRRLRPRHPSAAAHCLPGCLPTMRLATLSCVRRWRPLPRPAQTSDGPATLLVDVRQSVPLPQPPFVPALPPTCPAAAIPWRSHRARARSQPHSLLPLPSTRARPRLRRHHRRHYPLRHRPRRAVSHLTRHRPTRPRCLPTFSCLVVPAGCLTHRMLTVPPCSLQPTAACALQ